MAFEEVMPLVTRVYEFFASAQPVAENVPEMEDSPADSLLEPATK